MRAVHQDEQLAEEIHLGVTTVLGMANVVGAVAGEQRVNGSGIQGLVGPPAHQAVERVDGKARAAVVHAGPGKVEVQLPQPLLQQPHEVPP